MPKLVPDARNRKVTEFFSRKQKTGSRPDQTVHEVSSSEQRSVIHISSDDLCSKSKSSQSKGVNREMGSRLSRFWSQDGGSSTAVSSTPSSSLSSKKLIPEATPPSAALFQSFQIPPNNTSKPSTMISTPLSTKSSKKRKQQPDTIIYSGESDGDVAPFPIIHVSPFRGSEQRESSVSRSFSQVTSGFRASTSPAPTPLAPLQNLQGPLKPSQSKIGAVVPTPSKPSPQPPKKAATTKHHGPSPPKRARLSPAEANRAAYTPDCDADDEKDPIGTNGTLPWHADPDPDENVFLDDRMDVDAEYTPRSAIQTQQNADSSSSNDKVASRRLEILPSSQEAEVELLIDLDNNPNPNAHEPNPLPAASAQPSPSKARAIGIIARIKANAEIQAATQAQQERNLTLLGLTDDGSDLSDVPKMNSPESDESDLELELDTIVKGTEAKLSSSASAHPSISNEVNTRRSTRHLPSRDVKLQLFRDDSPGPSTPRTTSRPKPKSNVACPLDTLLKDNRREEARKARVEGKRITKAWAAEASGSDESDVSDSAERVRGDGRKRIRRSFSNTSGDGSEAPLMGDEAREALLGKEDAEAVGRILEKDRRKKDVVEVVMEHGFRFWSAIESEMVDSHLIPSLQIKSIGEDNPFVTVLNRFLDDKDYQKASALIDSGVLLNIPPSIQLLKWFYMLALSASEPNVCLSAYRSLLTLLRDTGTHFSKTPPSTELKLTASDLLLPLAKMGPNNQLAELLFHHVEEPCPIVSTSQDVKTNLVARFIVIMEALGRTERIDTSAVPTIISILLLLGLNSTTSPDIKHSIVSAIETILASPSITRDLELSISNLIQRVITCLSFPINTQSEMLYLLSGCTPVSGRIRRWVAWQMLTGDGATSTTVAPNTYTAITLPPVGPVVNIFNKEAPGAVKLQVDPDTDYMVLEAKVHILAIVLTDIEGYIRSGSGEGKLKGSEAVQKVLQGLETLMGKIVDTRAAHLDRTRTKDAINRLHKRVVHQRRIALDAMRKTTGKVDQFFVPLAKGGGSKLTGSGKPTPTATGLRGGGSIGAPGQ
ncbi:hypothetical protein BU17DRAFT_72078 [Hysterangium stoloniferum]|nr:hypothetical protein BU17DRAFT_72078 [Hysterangium stoloniferum]